MKPHIIRRIRIHVASSNWVTEISNSFDRFVRERNEAIINQLSNFKIPVIHDAYVIHHGYFPGFEPPPTSLHTPVHDENQVPEQAPSVHRMETSTHKYKYNR